MLDRSPGKHFINRLWFGFTPLRPTVESHYDIKDLQARFHIKTNAIHDVAIKTGTDDPSSPAPNILFHCQYQINNRQNHRNDFRQVCYYSLKTHIGLRRPCASDHLAFDRALLENWVVHYQNKIRERNNTYQRYF